MWSKVRKECRNQRKKKNDRNNLGKKQETKREIKKTRRERKQEKQTKTKQDTKSKVRKRKRQIPGKTETTISAVALGFIWAGICREVL